MDQHPSDFHEDDQGVDGRQARQEACPIEPTKELYAAYHRFYYAVQSEQAGEAVRQGAVPQERELKTYAEFVAYFQWLQENDPPELLSCVARWRQGFEESRRDTKRQVRAIMGAIPEDVWGA